MCFSQFYLKGYTGYALSTGNGASLTSYETSSELISETWNLKNYASSYRMKFGEGVNLGLSIGYALNKNVAFEITGNTQLLSKFKYSHSFQLRSTQEDSYSWSAEGFFADLDYTNTLFQVSPQVVFKSNPYNQWTFYLKGGPDFAWIKLKETIEAPSFDFPIVNMHIPSTLSTVKYSGNMNVGMQCSFGTEYNLSKNTSVFAELTMVNVKYKFKKYKVLRYEIDGVNSISELEPTESNDENNKIRYNHTGLNLGLKYTFK
jgi:opacity protein-like surface antigen